MPQTHLRESSFVSMFEYQITIEYTNNKLKDPNRFDYVAAKKRDERRKGR